MKVEDALIGRTAEVIGDALGGSCMRQAGACSDDPEFCGCQRAARAALAAVIPAIQAEALERAAVVADGMTEEWGWEVAAAIRALKEGT